MSSTLNTIFARASNPKYLEGDLAESHLSIIIEAAMTANDHGRLRPWRFIIFKGPGKERLIDAYIEHECAKNSTLSQKAKKRQEKSSAIICVIASPKECKIPKRDQLFSAAAACQLITLSAYSLGISSIWRTGKYAESDIVKKALKIESYEEIVGFIHLGKNDNIPISTKEFTLNNVITFS